MPITFERATTADADDLLRVEIAAFNNDSVIYPGIEIGGPPGYASIDTVLRKIHETTYYKIVFDGRIVGGIVIYDEGEGHFHLDLIFIDPDYHNRGIGTQAMQFLERTHPAKKWTLDTPLWAVRNHHFYEKFGYVRVGEREEQENAGPIVLIAYEKTL